MINIRQATPTDIPVIARLADEIWWPTYSPILASEQIAYMLNEIYSHQALLKTLKSGSQTFLLLSDHQGPQGFASYGPMPNPAEMKLHKLYVRPSLQGKGYGVALVKFIKEKSILDQKESLLLNVNRFNPAKTFYERVGFQVVAEVDVAIGPYWMNDYVMKMPLK